MKYHIDTIPVWDAVKLDGECFLCALRRRTELSEAERYLGASVMEPDTRIQVNAKGFCQKHQVMLFDGSNRLGHALMLDTHLKETQSRIQKPFADIRKAAHAYSDASGLERLTSKGQNAKKELSALSDKVASMSHSCILCDSIAENIERYLHTFFHLYHTDTEFRQKFAASKGVCLPDAALLLNHAADELPGKEVAAFVDTLCDLTEKHLDRTEGDLSWFIKKYDYRFDAEPWKDSRDAVERTVNKLRGWCVGQEPNPKE